MLKHKSVESAGEARLTELFALVFLRNTRDWPQLQKGADSREEVEQRIPSGLCLAQLLHAYSYTAAAAGKALRQLTGHRPW